MSYLRALYDNSKILRKKILMEKNFESSLKKFGSNLYFHCFENQPSITSLDYLLGKNFDGTFFGDNNPKCADLGR